MDQPNKMLIPNFLRNIPQSNQDAQTIASLVDDGTDSEKLAILAGYSLLLQTLGVVEVELAHPIGQTMLRATSQAAKYALMSLASYVESDLRVVDDWRTRGVQDLPDGDILARGAKLVYALESRRLDLIPDAPPSRIVKVAQVLIKRTNPKTGKPELLFQFDKNAGQYQLIGGRWSERDGDDMLKTIVREIDEEVEASDIVYQRDYQLELIAADVSPTPTLSPTFGALSQYHFWFYQMTNLTKPLILQEEDQWVPAEQVLAGYATSDDGTQYPFSFMDIYEAMNAAAPGGLLNMPDSFSHQIP